MFCDNLKTKMVALDMTAKDVANAMEQSGFVFRKAKKPHRVVESWMSKTRPYHPELLTGVALAKALGTTIEELVDGEAGADYVRKVVRNDPRAIQVPDRLFSIVENLLFLDENELIGIRANVEALAEAKKGNSTGMSGLLG
jgi:hypothetical protein